MLSISLSRDSHSKEHAILTSIASFDIDSKPQCIMEVSRLKTEIFVFSKHLLLSTCLQLHPQKLFPGIVSHCVDIFISQPMLPGNVAESHSVIINPSVEINAVIPAALKNLRAEDHIKTVMLIVPATQLD